MYTWRIGLRIWSRTTLEAFKERRDIRDVVYECRAATLEAALESVRARKEAEWPLRHWTGQTLYAIRTDVEQGELGQ